MPPVLYPDADGVLHAHPVGLINCTNEEYHSGPGISKSHLDSIASGSPLHYWHKYLNPNRKPEEPTEAKILGSAIHSAILEPHLFLNEYVAAPPDAPKRPTKTQLAAKKPSAETLALIGWWNDFEKEHAGKIVLKPDDFQRCIDVRDRVHSHPEVSGLFQGGKAEQSFYAYFDEPIFDAQTGEEIDVSDELVKCRFDYLHDSGELSVDLKSTDDASRVAFGKSIANYRYMLQPAWYHSILKRLYGTCPGTWVFVAVEKEPPFAIGVYYAEPDQVERGRVAAMQDFARIARCRKANTWPDYAAMHGVQAALLPAWAKV